MMAFLEPLVRAWAAGQGLKKLREFAASETPDVTFKWKQFRYGVWVAEGEKSPREGLRRVGKVKVIIQGNIFSFWFGKV
jgi:hypothetical protein